MLKRRKFVTAIVLFAASVMIGSGAYSLYGKTPESIFRMAKVERGNIVVNVSATGTVGAVTTVSVGTQVSGTIQKLFVDYNSKVSKGQVIACIDPAIFNAQVEQSRGNLFAAEANLQKAKVTAADALRTLDRNRRIFADGIISQSEFDAAQTASDMAQAGVQAAKANVTQMRGALNQARTNLDNATIRSPVDGVVISRSVDVGQTVAASLQTPTLFTIAQDLTRMQIETSVDESDISRVRTGQPVTFTVDAYPGARFAGVVTQVRNAPVTVSNVVTYVVVVGVNNRDLRLKPGMTANVSIETMRRERVLMVPAAALRFSPEDAAGKGTQSMGRQTNQDKNRQSADKVYVLGPDMKPRQLAVTAGIANDSFVEMVAGGLKKNDTVIVGVEGDAKKAVTGAAGGPMGPRF